MGKTLFTKKQFELMCKKQKFKTPINIKTTRKLLSDYTISKIRDVIKHSLINMHHDQRVILTRSDAEIAFSLIPQIK